MFLIAVVSVVEGMSRYMTNEFAARILGVNTFTLRRIADVFVGEVTEETWREWMRRPLLYPEEVAQVRAVLPSGVRTAVETDGFLTAVSPWNRPRRVLAIGTDGDYFQIKKYDLSAGRAFTAQEVQLGAKVVVIGTDIAEHFFPSLDPIGRELRIDGVPFQVIGVLEK